MRFIALSSLSIGCKETAVKKKIPLFSLHPLRSDPFQSSEMATEAAMEDPVKSEASLAVVKKKRNRLIYRIWRGIFGSKNEDYEKKLEHLSKEEASVHARMKRRALKSRKAARNIIIFSVIIEVVAVAFAITAVRSLDLNWKMKIVRSLPVIFSLGLSFVIHTTVVGFTRMLDRKDQKTLERLRAERKAKLDELKERTNYFATQQLIQRYDLDPAAKAAAASVLASKLGADSGLKVSLGDEFNGSPSSARCNDAELVPSSRRQAHSRASSNGCSGTPQSVTKMSNKSQPDAPFIASQGHMVVEHYRGPRPSHDGWIGRLAALLAGEDSPQSYALVCGNCLRHNGLARREDFPCITYYCPHCHALNTSRASSGTSTLPPSDDGATLLRDSNNASSTYTTTTGSEVTSNTAATTAISELPLVAAE